MLRVQFDSMLSGVWKSTGVTIVIRFLTLCGCIAREAQRERAALADAEQVDLRHAGVLRHRIDAAPDIAVDVVVEGQPAIGAIRIAPVDQVDILALRQQVADQRLVRLQVDHVGPIDQRIDDQDRRLRGRLRLAAEAIDDELVLAIDLFLGGDAEVDVVERAQHLGCRPPSSSGTLTASSNSLGCFDIERAHQRSPPRLPDPVFTGLRSAARRSPSSTCAQSGRCWRQSCCLSACPSCSLSGRLRSAAGRDHGFSDCRSASLGSPLGACLADRLAPRLGL